MISYAQNFEDVMLWRALKHVEKGNYIDIGAQDPIIDSVSLAFHELGWRGIHVEPTPHYAELLRQRRPGDTVIQAAVGNGSAILRFFEIPDTGISTADPVIAQRHRERGFDVQETTVPCVALSAILDTCAEFDIHWLKIDVEGFEKQVLTSWGKSRARPWIVVVESTLPMTQIETHETWESILIAYGYTPVYFDGLNRFYISDAHSELKDAFRAPPNVFDGFTLNGTASTSLQRLIETRHAQQLNEIVTQNEQQELTAANEIERLTLSLAALDKEHAEHEQALSQQYQSLQQELRRIELEQAQREQVHAEQTSQIRQELENLLRAQVRREQEISAQLLTTQQQAHQEISEQSKKHHEQTQALQREHAEREQALSQQYQSLQQELRRIALQQAQREQLHAEQTSHIRQELENLLRAQVQREQEISAQLLTTQQQAHQEMSEQTKKHNEQTYILQHEYAEREREMAKQLLIMQQQAHQEISEQSRKHHEQTQALQREHAEREQALSQQYQSLQQELQNMEQIRIAAQQQFSMQLQTEHEAGQHLQQMLNTLQHEIIIQRNSLSWRLTTPFRAIAGWFKPTPIQTEYENSATTQVIVASSPSLESDTAAPATPEPTSSLPNSEITSMTSDHSVPATPSGPTSPAQNLKTLLQYHDRQFIECAYLTLLKRQPDPEGFNYYLARLYAGVSKIQILGQLLDSDEASESDVDIPELRNAVKQLKLTRLPLVGPVIKYFLKVEGNSTFESRLRAIEQQVFRLEKQSDICLERINHNLNDLQKLIIQQNQLLLASVQQTSAKITQSTMGINLGTELTSSSNPARITQLAHISYATKTTHDNATNNSSLVQRDGVIYYFVDHTIKCPINTGMQRVVRRLGRALSESIETLRFIKWDSALKALVLINRDELEHLSQWHGPDVTGEMLRTYPSAGDEPVLIETQKSVSSQWLVIPEVTHITYHANPVTLDIIGVASRMSLKTAFIYYDAIPLRLAEYKDSAEKHAMYMQHLLLADLIIPISFRSGIELADFFKIHQGSTTSIPKIQTIPLPGESQLSPRISNPIQFTTDEDFILSVGSIEPRKNQINLVKAFENFCKSNPDTKWRLVLAGNLRGDVAEEINASIRRNSRISYVQNPSDIELDNLYKACAFTAFPSIEEGFGLPILESLWYAKPCICANFGAMAEVAEGGGCYLVDTHRIDDLEKAISNLAKHPELRQRLAQEAASRPIGNWQDYSQNVIGLIEEESNPLHNLDYIFYWVDDTCVNAHNSGIQRVVRQLAKALISLGIRLIPIKWNTLTNHPYSPSAAELSHLSKWNGPQPDTWAAWIDPRQVSTKSWILIPELTHQTLNDVKKYALKNSLRCSAIFYDAIPWKMRKIFPSSFAENHHQYMEDLSKFDKVLPISNYSHSELTEFLLSSTIRTQSLDHRLQTCTLPTEFIDVPRVTNIKWRSNSVIKILSVISMEPRKNPLALLEAFAIANSQAHSKIELTLVGRKIEAFAELSASVESHISLLENVTWEKNVDDTRLHSLYAQSDFTIFPSIEEGFGLPILESLWYAVPCICHNKGAMMEVAEGGGCLTIDVTDITAFSNAIVRLADDCDLRFALASTASRRPIKTWLDYAQELAVSMATDRHIFTNNATHTVADEVSFYQELVNLEQRPLLSICISTYNRAEWLSVGLRNLERLIPNPNSDVEIFVCDNTSTDHTPDIVKPYLSRSDFKYLRNEKNVGMLGNLRVTAHHARGHYIWILGDDDLALPGSIEKILSIIRARRDLALIYLNYSYTRETDASMVKDIDQFLSQATNLIEPSQDMAAPVKDIAANNENLFTAIYCLVFRRDHALRAYSQDTDGRPFSTMRTSIPTTYYVLNYMMEEPAYWLGTPQLVVNFNVSWNKYAALQILERVPEAQDLAERMGASPTGMDRWRQNLFPGFVHYFTEMFENDVHSNAEFFSPIKLIARMKHIEAFGTLVPALKMTYESAYERRHPCAKMPPKLLFSAFKSD